MARFNKADKVNTLERLLAAGSGTVTVANLLKEAKTNRRLIDWVYHARRGGLDLVGVLNAEGRDYVSFTTRKTASDVLGLTVKGTSAFTPKPVVVKTPKVAKPKKAAAPKKAKKTAKKASKPVPGKKVWLSKEDYQAQQTAKAVAGMTDQSVAA